MNRATRDWTGCYDDGWRDLIVPEAFSHPAKMARGLVARIFDELFAGGALKRGDVCVDPFGGIGTTAIEGASRGVQVVCCELESKFVDLARKNFDLHRRDWEAMGRPLPIMVQGDSRQLRKHVGPVLVVSPFSERTRRGNNGVTALVASPPYAGAKGHPSLGRVIDAPGGDILGHCTTGANRGDERYGCTSGQLGAMPEGEVSAVISSPPYSEGFGHGGGTAPIAHDTRGTAQAMRDGYGIAPGQLGEMATGSVEAVISSPPYAEIASGAGGLNTRPPRHEGQQAGRSGASASQDTDPRYGVAEGQLARLPKGDVDAIVSSLPYEECDTKPTKMGGGRPTRADGDGAGRNKGDYVYGTTDGQLGVMRGGAVDAVVSSPPFTQGYCLTPNHRILTADLRWVRCGELSAGDRLLAFDENVQPNRKVRRLAFATVLHSTPAVRPCVRVTLENGESIDCTVDHPWLTDRYRQNGGGGGRCWTKAGDLKGLYVLRALRPWGAGESYASGWIAGIFDGEGHIAMRRNPQPGHEAFMVGFAQKPGAVLDRMVCLLQSAGFDCYRSERKPTHGVEIRGGVPEILRALGTYRPMRLLTKFQNLPVNRLGLRASPSTRVKVVSVTPIGTQVVQSIETSTSTYIGEGHLMHNSGGGGINIKGYGKDGADKVGSRTYQGTGAERAAGNLETLTLSDVDAVVSSPPYTGDVAPHRNGIDCTKFAPGVKTGGPNSQARAQGYGDTEGQIGGLRSAETFWEAAKQIVEEAYAILRPGGTAVWVVKSFVRDKTLVDFPGDWRKLCEHVGFETTREIHAMLVQEETRSHLFDGTVTTRRERKSFFRRLAEKKGSPRVDWETVYFMVKR